jgi:hypothetical protein
MCIDPGRALRPLRDPLSEAVRRAVGPCGPDSPAVADLRLAPAAARARVVAPGRGEDPTDLVGVTAAAEQLGHQAHRPVDEGEEGQVAGTQIVETRLPGGSRGEPVTLSLSVTGESNRALAALRGQSVGLGLAESTLLG